LRLFVVLLTFENILLKKESSFLESIIFKEGMLPGDDTAVRKNNLLVEV
jgi:hypothetical protein